MPIDALNQLESRNRASRWTCPTALVGQLPMEPLSRGTNATGERLPCVDGTLARAIQANKWVIPASKMPLLPAHCVSYFDLADGGRKWPGLPDPNFPSQRRFFGPQGMHFTGISRLHDRYRHSSTRSIASAHAQSPGCRLENRQIPSCRRETDRRVSTQPAEGHAKHVCAP